MRLLAALSTGFNNIAPIKLAPSAFFTFTPAARSWFGMPDPRPPAGHLKRLLVDSG